MSSVTVKTISMADQVISISASVPRPPWITVPLVSGVKPIADTQTALTGLTVAERVGYQPQFTVDPDVGIPFVRNTNVSVGLVLEVAAQTHSVEEVARRLPTITVDDVHAALRVASAVMSRPQYAWDGDELNALLLLRDETSLWETITPDPWAKTYGE
ncbi:MAG: DUF433 domain-containing protein [Anaerolineales bacterium]